MDFLHSVSGTETDPNQRPYLLESVFRLNELPCWSSAALPWTGGQGRRATVTCERALQEAVPWFTAMTERHGGGHGAAALAAYLAHDVTELLRAPATDRVHAGLLSAAAQLSHVLAAMHADAGHEGAAQRYFAVARSLAQEAGQPRLFAISSRAASAQLLRHGHALQALQWVDAALDAAGRNVDGSTAAFLYAQRALSHARAGYRSSALADLATADHEISRAGEAQAPGPFTSYPLAGLAYVRGEVLMELGESQAALRAWRSSLARRAAHHRRGRALTHARIAQALLQVGHLEAACQHWRAFLDEYPHLRSAVVRGAAVDMRRRLVPYGRQRAAAAVLQAAREIVR